MTYRRNLAKLEATMKDDPAIRRIRDVRHQISEEHGHDPKRLVAYYLELQRQRQEEMRQKLIEVEQKA